MDGYLPRYHPCTRMWSKLCRLWARLTAAAPSEAGAIAADDVAKLKGDVPAEDDEEKPKEKPVEDDFDKSLTVKGKKK